MDSQSSPNIRLFYNENMLGNSYVLFSLTPYYTVGFVTIFMFFLLFFYYYFVIVFIYSSYITICTWCLCCVLADTVETSSPFSKCSASSLPVRAPSLSCQAVVKSVPLSEGEINIGGLQGLWYQSHNNKRIVIPS